MGDFCNISSHADDPTQYAIKSKHFFRPERAGVCTKYRFREAMERKIAGKTEFVRYILKIICLLWRCCYFSDEFCEPA